LVASTKRESSMKWDLEWMKVCAHCGISLPRKNRPGTGGRPIWDRSRGYVNRRLKQASCSNYCVDELIKARKVKAA